jgi:hypothetical protein
MTDHDPNNLHGGRPPFTLRELTNTGLAAPYSTRATSADWRDWLNGAPDEEAREEVRCLLLVLRIMASELHTRDDGDHWRDVTDDMWRCTELLERACNAAGRPLRWPQRTSRHGAEGPQLTLPTD